MTIKAMAAGLLAGAALWAGAGAQERPEHLTAYKAYTDAKAAGDAEAARARSEAAWRAAERDVGDAEVTAILAQNHLLEVLWTEPEAAAAPAARALALGRAGMGLGNMTSTELAVADAYARAAAQPRKRDLRAALYAALAADRASGRGVSAFTVQASRAATFRASEARDWEDAYAEATALARELEAMDADPGLSGFAHVQRVAAMLSQRRRWARPEAPEAGSGARFAPSSRWVDRVRDARVVMDHAATAFPAAATIDDVDPVDGAVHAWHGVIQSLLISNGIDMPEDWTFEGRGMLEDVGVVSRADGEPPECEIAWTDRKVRYPAAAGRGGYIGGVMLGYHLDPDGTVTGARILGEVPTEKFGPDILRQMEKWRADTAGLPPECLRDQVVKVQFTMP